MKKLFTLLLAISAALAVWAQEAPTLPALHVEGKWLVDSHGNHVVLHGVMDTPNAYFNGGRWGWSYASVTPCLSYFEKIFSGLEEAHCNVFRLHLDPAWTNDPAKKETGTETGEANISRFSPTRLTTYLKTLYYPLMQKAMNHGMYVVVRPPGVCPADLKVGDYYQQYLMTVWDLVTQNDSVRKYSGQISIELANEPVRLKNSLNADDKKALHDYFQPIVDKIRANGFTGIIWVPGTGWQSNYADYKTYPVTGYNIGYAVHDYTGWYGCSDQKVDNDKNEAKSKQDKINQFHSQVPVVDTAPVIITEVDWSPRKEGTGHLNEHGEWVESNYGTWSTGSTSKWGKCYKAMLDHYGNISMTLSGTACLLDIDTLLNKKKVVAAFGALDEACGKACMDWYADYYTRDYPKADFSSVPVSDFGTKYQNPIVRADFPDPDVIRVGTTYYMVSTTMHHFPGATILKSQDLVNWEYCAHPLLQLSDKDGYDLLKEANAYGSGMWACSMKYCDGRFHILINEKLPVDGWHLQGWLLTATNPEGQWTARKLSRSYYDPGMLFDEDGKVYVACGAGNITMCELDKNFNFKRERTVIKDRDGLEGCHLYKRGDYYYIYATYGGWPSGQALFRSTDIFGPYEEQMVVEKRYDGKPNTIHQGALVEDINGRWWTVMQEDLGPLGRMPNLQPITWTSDGWLKVGTGSKPYESFVSKVTKPSATGDISPKRLPTTDAFRTYPLGMQWEWNHRPDSTAWSLFERPGWLRLKAVSVTSKLSQARGMLTQRIFANPDKASTGSVKIDVSGLADGDRAGICILQDPYAMIAVERSGDQYQLVWQQEAISNAGESFVPATKTQTVTLPDGIVYLRASIKYGENSSRFFYSTTGKTWQLLGNATPMTFNLSVFVGARFGLFCHATKQAGGMADFDWFTTEAEFDEADIYPESFTPAATSQYETTKIAPPATQKTLDVMIGQWRFPIVTATYADNHTADVATQTNFSPAQAGIVEFYGGAMLGVGQGSTEVSMTFTDNLGNRQSSSLTAKSSYFPFDAQYIQTDIAGTGTYRHNTSSAVFKFTTADNQQGWIYDSAVDFSPYRYLVIKLSQKQAAGAQLNIYTSNSLTGACATVPLSTSELQTVVDLTKTTYTSKTTHGKALNLKNIRMVTLSGTSAGKLVSVSEMLLTSDSQYDDPTGIVEATASTPAVDVYTLSGRLVRRHVSRSQALQGLAPGLYIVDGRKVVVN